MGFIESLVDYLKTALDGQGIKVAGIVELEEAMGVPSLSGPTVFAYILSDDAAVSQNVTNIMQKVTVTFALVIAVPNKTNPLNIKGAGDPDPLAPIRTLVLNATLGWQYDGGYDPSEFQKGRLALVKNKALWWQDDFITIHYLRK